ncbi:TR10A factor, partial [Psophia crepitans]|nr:TR10A factor [Psophia crepitans]
EQNGSSKCSSCKKDEYIEYPNDFAKCLGCRTCREDQVERSPCQPTSDTQCVCKNGTFCSPDHPCEMCQKCRPRCPAGEVEQAPCTPHSDLQCGPSTNTSSGLSTLGIVAIAVALSLLVLLFLLCWWCCCRSPGDGRDLSRKSCSVVVTRYRRGGLGTQDNIHNEQLCQHQLLTRELDSVTANTPRMLSFQVARISYPIPKPRRNLVPVQGNDPATLLRRSFDIFAQEVPYKDWKRYGRALDLRENDITLAELNDKGSLEPFFQILNKWQNREGMKASVNTLLETLHEIDLGGIAEDISSKLVQRRLFDYEVS